MGMPHGASFEEAVAGADWDSGGAAKNGVPALMEDKPPSSYSDDSGYFSVERPSESGVTLSCDPAFQWLTIGKRTYASKGLAT